MGSYKRGGPGQQNPAGAEDPWGQRRRWQGRSGRIARLGCDRLLSDPVPAGAAKARCKLDGGQGHAGRGLTLSPPGQAHADRLALEPYWGKPNVRNLRGGGGDVGIIRSPIRATVLPDRWARSQGRGLVLRGARRINAYWLCSPGFESMRSLSFRTVWFFFLVGLAVASIAAILFFVHVLITKAAGRTFATIFVVVCAGVLTPAIAYGLYSAVRIQVYGDSLDSRMERISQMTPQSPRLFFFLLLSVIFLTFATIYRTALTLLFWLASLAFGGSGSRVAIIISGSVVAVSVFFAVWTCIWLWRQLDRGIASKAENRTRDA